MKILGINISHHASSCLLIDNEIKFLLEDERINRKKGYIPEDDLDDLENGSFKINFAEELLNYTSHLDYVIFSSFGRTNNFDNFIIERYKEGMKKSGITWNEVIFESDNHHIYHACSGFYGSEFDESVALILDGGGSIYQDGSDFLGKNSQNYFREVETIFKLDYKSGVQPLWKHHTLAEQNTNIFVENLNDNIISNSLSCGRMFNLFAYELGFSNGDDSGKVMGMSSYHKESEIKKKYRWWRDIDWFTEMNNIWITSPELHYNLQNINPFPYERLSKNYDDFLIRCDIANKMQEETLNHTKRLIIKAVELSKCKNVVISGGYALNCLNNYQYLDIDTEINLYVDPVCYDAGTSLGAAKWLYYKLTKSMEKNPLTSLYLS